MSSNYFDMSGKVALVTGASGGIGSAIAKGYLEQGARVYLVARKLPQLEEAHRTLSAHGDCHMLQADLSTGEASKALAQAFAALEEKLDVLVNCAGNAWAAPMEEFPDSGWDKVMAVNLRATFNLTRDLLPQLKKSGAEGDPARVINIGSIAGITAASENTYSYSACKAGVHQLTRNLALELAPHINVNAIAPGRFPSNMTAHHMRDAEFYKKDCERIPMKRYGRLEEISALAITLATTAGAFMTGDIVTIDGGFTLNG